MEKTAKIYIAGHTGLVGSAIERALLSEGYSNIIRAAHQEVDLTKQQEVEQFFQKEHPDYVFLAAAKVGGIYANSMYPAGFIYENLMIEANVIHQAWENGVKKLLFLGSSCIYPKLAKQPIAEEALLTGPPEPTNEAYAIAKIAGIKLCQAYNQQYGTKYIPVIPASVYGPNDNFDLQKSHVLAALLRKFHEAKISGQPFVTLWGTGNPIREFLYVDDLADACIFLMNTYGEDKIVNIGTGTGLTIKNLAKKIKDIVGYEGNIVFDSTKPDGMPEKINNVSYLHRLGWKEKTSFTQGLQITYDWFKNHYQRNVDGRFIDFNNNCLK